MKYLVFFFALTLTIPLTAQNNYDTVTIRTLQLAPSVYMLMGSGGNIGVLTGEDGTLVIDDEFAPLSDKIKAAIQKIGGGDAKLLINTHVHGDHTGGNENFKKWGALIIAQDEVRERMMHETKNGNNTIPPRDKDAWPVMTFPNRLNIHWDGEDLQLMHFGPGHTDGDVIIRFPKANIIHTGDLFVRYGYPFIDTNSGGSYTGFISNLDSILAIADDHTRIIPGHGVLSSKKDVQLLRDRLVDIRDQVQAALNRGVKKDEVAGLPIATKYDKDWGGGFITGKEFVLMMAEDLLKSEQATGNR